MKAEIKDKGKNEDGNYFHREHMNVSGDGQDGPDDQGDPLRCETDLKIAKSESSEHPFEFPLIKIDQGFQRGKIQCNVCYLEFTAEEDLKNHTIEAHGSSGADPPTGVQQMVETNN